MKESLYVVENSLERTKYSDTVARGPNFSISLTFSVLTFSVSFLAFNVLRLAFDERTF